MLTLIKTIHTLIWAVMASATLYILYAGITNIFNIFVLLSLVLISFETVVLLYNKWVCPLTPLAEKYTVDRRANFDIYLPRWLAQHNKSIFGTLFVVGIVLLILK